MVFSIYTIELVIKPRERCGVELQQFILRDCRGDIELEVVNVKLITVKLEKVVGHGVYVNRYVMLKCGMRCAAVELEQERGKQREPRQRGRRGGDLLFQR